MNTIKQIDAFEEWTLAVENKEYDRAKTIRALLDKLLREQSSKKMMRGQFEVTTDESKLFATIRINTPRIK